MDVAKFRSTTTKILSEKADMDEARGTLGSLYKTAEDDFGLHRAAFKAAEKLSKKDPRTAQEFSRHFIAYCAELGVFDQIDAFDKAEAEEASEPAEEEPEPAAAAA